MTIVEYTHKGISKLQEYTNLSKEACQKLIRRAYVNGIDIEDLPSKEKAHFANYIDTTKRTGLVYGEYCFVFADNYCVNVLKQPKKANYCGKDKIKNLKKYTKHYDLTLNELCA